MLSDRTIIVAGGARGIGRAAAIELARNNANVVVSDLGTSVNGEGSEREPLEETVELARRAGGNVVTHFGDIASMEDTSDLVDVALEEFGRIDGAANFAGILRDSISWKMTEDQFDHVVNVHLRGHFALLRTVSAHWREQAVENGNMLKTQRSFVGVSSRSAFGSIGQLNYAAAKAGVLGMVRTAAMELQRFNVRVNALVPTAHTRMTESIPEAQRKQRPSPRRVAPVVAFLMSQAADGINGCTIRAVGDQVGLISDPAIERTAYMNGGWTADELAERFVDALGEYELDRTQIG